MLLDHDFKFPEKITDLTCELLGEVWLVALTTLCSYKNTFFLKKFQKNIPTPCCYESLHNSNVDVIKLCIIYEKKNDLCLWQTRTIITRQLVQGKRVFYDESIRVKA